ncbi:hypothetical protein [Catellatospora sp. NPDC049609]|uniref:hypothetical protein n=1 Tax=Catellatospora sp. NPDC049609 TaxID=3155505 RepID=UPI0034411A1C
MTQAYVQPDPYAVPAPRAGDDDVPTRPTRHLSAGAYLDDRFCRAALNEVYHQPRRMVAPSYGFDLVTVLSHCKKARVINLARDGAIVFMLALSACVSFPTFLLLVVALIQLQLCVATYRLIRDVVRGLRGGGTVTDFLRLILRAWAVTGAFLLSTMLSFYFFAAAAMAAALAGAGGGFYGEPEPSTGADLLTGASTALSLLLLAVLCFTPMAANLLKQSRVDTMAPGRGRHTTDAADQRLAEIERQQRGNVVVYSGYQPFVGSGTELDRWGTAVRLVRREPNAAATTPESAREFPTITFTAEELTAWVAERINRLTGGTAQELLPGLTVEGTVFLAGSETAMLRNQMDRAQVSAVIANPTTPARYFLAFRVSSWQGELITNVYVHIAVQGRTLYVDMSSWALGPCRSEFRVVDLEGGTGLPAYLRAVKRGIVDAPVTVARAPINLIQAGLDALHVATRRGAVSPTGVDYGALMSVRELGSSGTWRNSLIEHDFTKYASIIQRRVLAAVLDFLENQGADVTEFRQRSVNILNRGIQHFGSGDINNDGAVGDNAKVTR